MKLACLDDQCVRVELSDGKVYEGACLYCGRSFVESEFGGKGDALKISDHLFHRNVIVKAEKIKEDEAFLAAYGLLEEEELADGLETVEDLLISDEPRNVHRLLSCLKAHRDQIEDQRKLKRILSVAYSYYSDQVLKEKIGNLLKEIEQAI